MPTTRRTVLMICAALAACSDDAPGQPTVTDASDVTTGAGATGTTAEAPVPTSTSPGSTSDGSGPTSTGETSPTGTTTSDATTSDATTSDATTSDATTSGTTGSPGCRSDDECPPGGPCEAAACDPETMQCGQVPLPDGGDCDDGLLCTQGPGTCERGLCVGGAITPVSLASIPPGRGFVIDGELPATRAGTVVAGLGDVNGDGLADLAVAPNNNFEFAPGEKGRIYVVFGKSDDQPIDLAEVQAGVGGFAIFPLMNAPLGSHVAAAGDVNGDGLADIAVGSYVTLNNGPYGGRGFMFVVLGKPESDPVALTDVLAGDGGFAVRGEPFMQLGNGVGGAGDVDGDGLDDLLVGEPAYPTLGPGRALVVFGGDAQPVREVAEIAGGQGGFEVVAEDDGEILGASGLLGAGDVDGDGHADLLIGDNGANVPFQNSGRFYFVRGKAGGAPIELAAVAAGQGGYVVAGAGPRGSLGSEAADLGDVNDDGLRDFMITAPYWHEMVDDPGSAYVVFGKLDGEPVALADLELGVGGYAITGQATQDGFGYRAGALGDLDGDGRVDFGVGALRTAYTQAFAGRVAVIFSPPAPTSLLAADLAQGLGGFVIDGAAMNDGAWRVAGAGDVNGDGIPDILVGAGGVDEKLTDAGRVYVLFGPVCTP
jgi:hypothetical protein